MPLRSARRSADAAGGGPSPWWRHREIFRLGRLTVNTTLQAHYNVVHPDHGATWQVRFQVQLMLPK